MSMSSRIGRQLVQQVVTNVSENYTDPIWKSDSNSNRTLVNVHQAARRRFPEDVVFIQISAETIYFIKNIVP